MSAIKRFFHLSNLNKIRLRTVIYIGLFWTAIDFAIVLLQQNERLHNKSLWLREIVMFTVSLVMGYIFVYKLRKVLTHFPLWLNFLAKSFILLSAAFILTFTIQFTNNFFFQHLSAGDSFHQIRSYVLYKNWLLLKNNLLDDYFFYNTTNSYN